jgi:hypothetical protein
MAMNKDASGLRKPQLMQRQDELKRRTRPNTA